MDREEQICTECVKKLLPTVEIVILDSSPESLRQYENVGSRWVLAIAKHNPLAKMIWGTYVLFHNDDYIYLRSGPIAPLLRGIKRKLDDESDQCKICTSTIYSGAMCETCGNIVCTGCYHKIAHCPFCRANMPELLGAFIVES